MRRHLVSIAGFAGIVVFAATPALAGVAPTPEPEVAGGIAALAALGVGYRLLRNRFGR